MSWRDKALCVGDDPELWFPLPIRKGRLTTTQVARTKAEQVDEARKICHACPVRDQCLQEAMDDTTLEGIWGGLTADERRAYAKTKKGANRRAYGRADAALRRTYPDEWRRLFDEAVKVGAAEDPDVGVYVIRKRATSVAYSRLRRRHAQEHKDTMAELRREGVAA